jgi:hypothetical protein
MTKRAAEYELNEKELNVLLQQYSDCRQVKEYV